METRDRLVGLLAYLAGPGRAEEHQDQRVVAGWHEGATEVDLLDPNARAELAHEMEAPARLHEMDTPAQGFVYHVPISLHADDGQLSDEQWAYVARKAVTRLEFDRCRWVAVHHGLAHSAQGPRDHLHLVVHRAREDGTVASTWNDHHKMASLRAELEDDPTLELRVKTQRHGGGRAGWQLGEQYRAEREDRDEPDRERLERVVRAAIGPAETEAEWVQSMRNSGVLVRPRYAAGGREKVVGYSVALPPNSGEQPVWYGGGRLARDLSLTAVRHRWDGHDPADALATWSKHAGHHAQNRQRLPSSSWEQAHRAIADFEQHMLSTPVSDHNTWRAFARETVEALAGLSTRAPQAERRTLQRAALALSRAAEAPHGHRRGTPSPGARAMRSACRIITSATIAPTTGVAAIAHIVQQLVRVSTALQQTHETHQNAATHRLSRGATSDLAQLYQRMQTAPQASSAARLVAVAQPGKTTPGPARGNPDQALRSPRQHEHRDRDRDHGQGR